MAVSRTEIDTLIQLVNSGDIEALKAEEFEQFQYQGFDPYKIVESLIKAKLAKSVTNDDFLKDLFTMVAVGLIKGNVNDHNIKKMSEKGQADLRAIISKYEIRKGGGQGLASGIITFPRTMATFPDVAVRMTSVVGGKEFRGGPMGSSRLPSYMQVQVFPAIIPKDLNGDIKKALLAASLSYSIDQTIQISRLQNPDVSAIAASQSNFVNINHNSPVPKHEVRQKVFKSLPLVKDYQLILAVLSDYKLKIDTSITIPSLSEFQMAV